MYIDPRTSVADSRSTLRRRIVEPSEPAHRHHVSLQRSPPNERGAPKEPLTGFLNHCALRRCPCPQGCPFGRPTAGLDRTALNGRARKSIYEDVAYLT